MDNTELADVLKAADEAFINEILREAEARLGAQLQSAIAADQRAMTLLGFILTLLAFRYRSIPRSNFGLGAELSDSKHWMAGILGSFRFSWSCLPRK